MRKLTTKYTKALSDSDKDYSLSVWEIKGLKIRQRKKLHVQSRF